MEIKCEACNTIAVAKPEPIYDGFKKIGTHYICTSCGKVYPSEEETPFVEFSEKPNIFGDDDKPDIPSIFNEDERQKSCRWCQHFVINPFTQRCGLTHEVVEATDLCVRFEKKEEEEEGGTLDERNENDGRWD
jgi:hypothetical protein